MCGVVGQVKAGKTASVCYFETEEKKVSYEKTLQHTIKWWARNRWKTAWSHTAKGTVEHIKIDCAKEESILKMISHFSVKFLGKKGSKLL